MSKLMMKNLFQKLTDLPKYLSSQSKLIEQRNELLWSLLNLYRTAAEEPFQTPQLKRAMQEAGDTLTRFKTQVNQEENPWQE